MCRVPVRAHVLWLSEAVVIVAGPGVSGRGALEAGGWLLPSGSPWGAGKATIDKQSDGSWKLTRQDGIRRHESPDDDTSRIWWNDTGVHQNLTFAVQPDPVSGMQCWHQRVTVGPASAGDQYGDVVVDTDKAHAEYKAWLAEHCRPAPGPGGLRRPLWYARPLKPTASRYYIGS